MGSAPVQSYSGGGDIADDAAEIEDTNNMAPGSTPDGGTAPNLYSPGNGMQTPGTNLWENLLGRSPGGTDALLNGPGRAMSGTSK